MHEGIVQKFVPLRSHTQRLVTRSGTWSDSQEKKRGLSQKPQAFAQWQGECATGNSCADENAGGVSTEGIRRASAGLCTRSGSRLSLRYSYGAIPLQSGFEHEFIEKDTMDGELGGTWRYHAEDTDRKSASEDCFVTGADAGHTRGCCQR